MMININFKAVKKTISIILVLSWMIAVFVLSGQIATESSATSSGITRWLLKLVLNDDIQIELILIQIEPIIRKIAHFVLYVIGGVSILNFVNEYKEKIKHTNISAILLGMIYAITDEMHQYFVPGRSAELLDVCIDTSGIISGVLILTIIKLFWDRMIKVNNKSKKNNKTKKVLFTATVDIHILNFHLPYLKMFKDNGYEVHVATNGNQEIPYCDKKHIISFERSPFKLNNLKAIKNLKKVINEEKFEIIHCHTPMGGVVTRLAAMKARKKGTRVIYTAHGFHFYKGAPKLNWLLFYPIEKMLSKVTDTLITINKEDYNLAKKKFHSKQIELVHGVGVDSEKFNFEMSEEEKGKLREELEIKKDDFVMLCIGELNDNKNQIMQIEAVKELVKEHENVKLLLAGEGDKRQFLEQKIEEYNLQDNVKLLGYRTDIPRLLKITDLSLSTSKREGLPVNVMEALLSGVPVIGTNCRGTRDLIQDNTNGYIIEVDDIEKLTKKINAIITTRIIISNSDKYTLKEIKKKMEKIYI